MGIIVIIIVLWIIVSASSEPTCSNCGGSLNVFHRNNCSQHY